MNKEGEVMLTVKDVTKFLKISRSKVYRLIEKGDLKAYKIGERGTRFKQSEIEEYIQRQQH